MFEMGVGICLLGESVVGAAGRSVVWWMALYNHKVNPEWVAAESWSPSSAVHHIGG